jgi:pimeloyl-ACP methyl ester carboxylesterase
MDCQPFSVETPSAGTICGLRWGSADGIPVLAAHGWLDNAASFLPIAPYLTGLNLVAIDLPGHGFSQHRPDGAHYHLMDYPPAVLEVADALGWEELVLLGHSLGGAISTTVAVAAPTRIRAMVLIENLGPASQAADGAPGRLRDSITAYAKLRDKAPVVYPELESLIMARARLGKMDHKAAQALVSRNITKVEGGYRWCSDPRLRLPSPVFLTESQVLAYLGAIEAPTRVLLANDGLLAKSETLTPRLASLQTASVQWLSGKHHLHMDDPGPVATAILDFLLRLD